MVENIQLISARTIEEVLKYEDLLPVIESALGKFSSRPESGVIQPLRTVLNVPPVDGFLAVMPSYSESDEALCTKLLTFFPRNIGCSCHQAFIALFNSETGAPTAILDGDVITARRTAAASAVASKHLVLGTPKQLAILGAGVQARSHFHALSHVFQFDKVTIWNCRPAKAHALAGELGSHVVAVDDPKEAVREADIIVTVTSSATPILFEEWVKPGAHINAVGACRPDWSEIDPKLMQKAAVYADSRESAVNESGDIIKSGAAVLAEIGEVILGKVQPKKSKSDITLFKSLGIAIEDAVTASLVMKRLGSQDSTCPK